LRIVYGRDLVCEYESSRGSFRAFCSRRGSPLHGRLDPVPSIRVSAGTAPLYLGANRIHLRTVSSAPAS